MKQFNTRKEVLQDAINYYWGKPERKCENSRICTYIPVHQNTEGCAIGRLVDEETQHKLQENTSSINSNTQFKILPQWLQNMGQDFLYQLQILHDFGFFAKKNVEQVTERMVGFSIDMSEIKFPE
jgi:hypothetical protein